MITPNDVKDWLRLYECEFSRAALDYIQALEKEVANFIRQKAQLELRIDALTAKAVDAEPVRHGRWDSFGVRTTDYKGRKRIEYMFNACTICEKPAALRTAFCPNCGAKMDAEVKG